MKQPSQDRETAINDRETVLKVENLSKTYRLGQIGTGTISHDLNRWWAKLRGKEDPFAMVGVANDRSQKDGTNEYVKVLNDINFEVKKGEVLGIIGKNGAGKSTLLKVISQITSPTTGSVKAKGRIASLLEVGTGMHPEMTGRENVYLNGTILGMTKKEIDSKFDEIMDFAGCAKYADTPVKRYSSGMKVRLGFAVAAFLEPEILIVDEVLAVGDAEFQRKAIGKMQDISKGDGRTVLFVSHNMASVRKICSQSILLDRGKIILKGETEHIIRNYIMYAEASDRKEEGGELRNEFVHIRGIKLPGATKMVDLNENLTVSLEVSFESPVDIPDLTFELKNELGDLLFHTGAILKEFTGSGIYNINVTFKDISLNTGKYFITLIIGENQQRLLFRKENVLDFEVVGRATRRLPGLLHPKVVYRLDKKVHV